MPGLADVAELVVLLKLKDEVSGGLKNINKNLTTLHGSSQKVNASYKIGQGIGLGIRNTAILAAAGVGILATQVAEGLQSLEKLDAVKAQTVAVLKSTGGAAGISAEQVRNLADKYEGLNAVIDDKVIQSAENVLLTFPRIKKDAFEPALLAALNLNTALGGDESSLQGRLITVAKALQDPAKGLTALRRVGVGFTSDQEKQIKALAKSGDLLGAQKIILGELNKEFGGSFATQGQTITGRIAAVGDAFEDLKMALAEGFLPVLEDALPALTNALRDPALVKTIRDVGRDIAGMFTPANIHGAIDFAKSVIPAILSGLKLAIGAAKTLLDVFNSLPDPVKGILVGGAIANKLTGGLVLEGVGDALKGALGHFFDRGSPGNPLYVVPLGGGLGGGEGLPGNLGKAGGAGGILGAAGDIAGGAAALPLGTAIALAATPLIVFGVAEALAGGPEGVARNDEAGRAATAAARGVPGRVPRGTFQGPDFKKALDAARKNGADTHNELRNIQRAERQVAQKVGDTRSELRRIQTAARSNVVATRQATEAIKDKDLSVTVPVTLTTAVSVHLSALSRNESIVQRLNGRASSVR